MKEIPYKRYKQAMSQRSFTLRFESGDNELSVEMDQFAGEYLWVKKFLWNGNSLFDDRDFDAGARWWLERWIIKTVEKGSKRSYSGKIGSKVEDAVINFKTENL